MDWFKAYSTTDEQSAIRKLDDASFRLWFSGRCYIARLETNGTIPPEQLPYFGPVGRQENAQTLVWAGLWLPSDDGGWVDVFWLAEQDSAEQYMRRKELHRARQERYRERAASGDASRAASRKKRLEREERKKDICAQHGESAPCRGCAADKLAGDTPDSVDNSVVRVTG